MAIFVNEITKVIVQGMTGSEGTKHTKRYQFMMLQLFTLIQLVKAKHKYLVQIALELLAQVKLILELFQPI